MIKKLTLTKELHPFKVGTSINFGSGLNLICGDQGTGKSTLLDMMMMHDRDFAQHIILEQTGEYRAFAYYSSEFHNPRVVDGGLSLGETRYNATLEMFYDKLRDSLASSRLTNAHHFQIMLSSTYAKCKNLSTNVIDKKLVNLDVITQSAMQSHGQALFPFIEEALKVAGGIVFLDEPETSLSIKSQLKLADMLIKASNAANQIFIATHSEILIKSVPKVLSLDEPTPTWVDSAIFLDKQYDRSN